MSEPLTGLDEAVEAAERAFVSASSPWPVDDKLWAKVKREMPNGTVHRRDILLVIEAVEPIIAAAVRADERAKVLAEVAAAGAVERVRTLHQPDKVIVIGGIEERCKACLRVHPCPTIRALTEPTP